MADYRDELVRLITRSRDDAVAVAQQAVAQLDACQEFAERVLARAKKAEAERATARADGAFSLALWLYEGPRIVRDPHAAVAAWQAAQGTSESVAEER